MDLFSERFHILEEEEAFKVGRDIQTCEKMGMEVIKLNLGEPDFKSADNINQVAINEILAGNSTYSDPQGILPLRESIARRVTETRGVPVKPEQVLVTVGGKPTMQYCMTTYVNPGDEVIYPSPGFSSYESFAVYAGAKTVPLHLPEEKDFRFDASDLEPLITDRTKLLILNSPSNPTGAVLSRSDLEGIAQVIKDKADPNLRILSDEYYETILFDGRKHESILSVPGMAERTILLSGHSKMYAMTGWRVGFAVLPSLEESLAFRLCTINNYSCGIPFVQMAAKAALDNDENLAIIENMRRQFEERRNVVVDALNQIEGISCVLPGGAFYAFPNVHGACVNVGAVDAFEKLPPEKQAKTSASEFFQRFALFKHGVASLDRKGFCRIGSEGQHFVRISMASDMKTLLEGVRRLGAAATDIDGFQSFLADGGSPV